MEPMVLCDSLVRSNRRSVWRATASALSYRVVPAGRLCRISGATRGSACIPAPRSRNFGGSLGRVGDRFRCCGHVAVVDRLGQTGACDTRDRPTVRVVRDQAILVVTRRGPDGCPHGDALAGCCGRFHGGHGSDHGHARFEPLAQSVDRGDGGGVTGDHDGLRAPLDGQLSGSEQTVRDEGGRSRSPGGAVGVQKQKQIEFRGEVPKPACSGKEAKP